MQYGVSDGDHPAMPASSASAGQCLGRGRCRPARIAARADPLLPYEVRAISAVMPTSLARVRKCHGCGIRLPAWMSDAVCRPVMSLAFALLESVSTV